MAKLPRVKIQAWSHPHYQWVMVSLVRVSGTVGRIGAGGILGLDFLGQYEDIHFHVPSFRLTLNGP